jgi:hypothetical protein
VSAIPPALRARTCAPAARYRLSIQQEARRHRGAPAYGQMVMNSGDLEDYEDGPSVDGVRYTNPNRFSRPRGARGNPSRVLKRTSKMAGKARWSTESGTRIAGRSGGGVDADPSRSPTHVLRRASIGGISVILNPRHGPRISGSTTPSLFSAHRPRHEARRPGQSTDLGVSRRGIAAPSFQPALPFNALVAAMRAARYESFYRVHDGGHHISYDEISEIARSHKGDKVYVRVMQIRPEPFSHIRIYFLGLRSSSFAVSVFVTIPCLTM